MEAIVITPAPLQVKTLTGTVSQLASGQGAIAGLKKGDLVQLSYAAGGGVAGAAGAGAAPASVQLVGATLVGTLKEVAADKTWLIVRSRLPGQPDNEVNVPLQADAPFWPLVAAMRPGDGVAAVYRGVDGVNRIRMLEWQYQPVPRWQRWLSLSGAAGLLFLMALLLTGFHPARLILGVDNRYSTSQLQTVLWFWVVISAYMALVFHRMASAGWSYVGGVDIPSNLLILSGVSVLTFTGAKLISRSKAADADAPRPQAAAAPRPADLVQDNARRTDLGDFQMVVITALAVLIYAVSTVEFMERIEFRRVVTMPDVDATLLAIFTLGQAAYLGKKAAGEGPAGN
ncbi:hypothetical protein [Rugamonas sp. DEMB1]|uniref:hypothetical protein n=1 Tax=Rugamonas sp. DEMB1 TaxID=3039386 RepID=UPI00244BC5B5|nr:hypothetical protein [Rugamonas sp. DEMB1]WGG53310.1 hypothetical protein QC826_15085 [Rugamonas sp. DEMB1]